MNYLPLVELLRGSHLESLHYGAIAVCDPAGNLLYAHGDPETRVFLRSCAKPFQALPLLESGAADAFGLDEQEIAICCASHDGTDRHFQVVSGLQRKAGISESDLQCGTHAPINKKAALELECSGQRASPNHHNCSGKHTGMLICALHLGADKEHYLDPGHPVQERIRVALRAVTGLDEQDIRDGIDGCSAPNFSIPLQAGATGFARLAQPEGMDSKRAESLSRIFRAMSRNPMLVSGEGRIDMRLMTAFDGRLVAKGGAEGQLALAVKARDGVGPYGIMIKIADGDPQLRAIPIAAEAVLRELGVLGPEQEALLVSDFDPAIKSHRGDAVGEMKASLNLR